MHGVGLLQQFNIFVSLHWLNALFNHQDLGEDTYVRTVRTGWGI